MVRRGVSVCKPGVTVGNAVLMTPVGIGIEGVENLLHDAKVIRRNKEAVDFPILFKFPAFCVVRTQPPNGWRYPLVGGTR